MRLIAFTTSYTPPEYKESNKFLASKEVPESGSLTVENLQPVACLGKSVLQMPDDLLKKQDESAVITCTHKIQSYDRILWYKQSQDVLGFKLMGNLYIQVVTNEPGFENKIKLEGDGRNNGTLTISNLTLTDSAVYFCAAYYTVLRITSV
ncbi:T-cell receptor beta variable [Labeo rohita]|nr:T-cell receptor beta variable [Labeo rohita]